MTKKAVIYDRASSAGQKDNWSREDAKRIGAELAERYGYAWELRQEVKSGETLEARPVMLGTLKDVEADLVGAIIVQDFTRLSRDEDGIDGRVIRMMCRDHDCKVITPQKVYDFSLDADDDMADFNFLVGKIHKRQTVKALVRGMQEKARQGRQVSGFTVLGYDRVFTGEVRANGQAVRELRTNESEAEVIRLIFQKFLELRSAGKVARWLNVNGYRKPVKSEKMRERYDLGNSRPFDRADVARVIQNPLYAGWATWGKNCDSRHLRDFEPQWNYRPDLQIVSQDVWDRANALRKQNTKTPARAVGSEYAFSMLLACKSCGGVLVGTSVEKPTGRHKKYRCSRRDKAGAVVCQHGQTINETVIARALIPVTAELIEKGLDLGSAMQEAARDMSHDLDGDLERAWRAELAEVERESQNIVRAIAKGTIDDDQAREVTLELGEKKVRLQRNLVKLQETVQMRQELLEAIPAILGDVEGVLWLFYEQRPVTLNQILRLVFAENSIVVEAWGANSNRESRVTSYRLSDAFAETVKARVLIEEGGSLGLPESTLVIAQFISLLQSAQVGA